MKREERVVGTSFTRRRIVKDRTETDEELVDGLQELAQWSRDPWEAQKDIFEWVHRAFELETRGKKRPFGFRPHEDAGWYLDELHIAIQTANTNIKKGDPRWAAYAGAKFGELWSEFRLKLAREELYCKAVEVRAAQATSKPKPSASMRVERWRHYFEITGKKTEADRLAAEELGDGESTVRGARSLWEKTAAGSD